LKPINSYSDICTSGYYGEGHDYWITMTALKKKVLIALTGGEKINYSSAKILDLHSDDSTLKTA
jgi:hypothetical protein